MAKLPSRWMRPRTPTLFPNHHPSFSWIILTGRQRRNSHYFKSHVDISLTGSTMRHIFKIHCKQMRFALLTPRPYGKSIKH
jgi:hypothetical protein